MSTRIIAVPGRSFDAGVADAVPAAAVATTTAEKRELEDPRLLTLSRLFMDGFFDEDTSAENSRECQQLIGLRMSLNTRTDAFLEKLRAPMRAKLIEEHESAKGGVRKHLEKIDELRAMIAAEQRAYNDAADLVAKTMSVFRGVSEDRRTLSRYATRAAIAAADERIVKAEKRVDAANASLAEVRQRLNSLKLVEMVNLQKELDHLKATELELGARISGEPWSDSLGIQHGPRPSIL